MLDLQHPLSGGLVHCRYLVFQECGMLTYEDLRLLQAVCASCSGNMSRRLSFGNIVAADNIESPAGTQGQLSVEISILPASFSLQCTVSTEASVQCNVRYLQQRACRDSSVMGEHLAN